MNAKVYKRTKEYIDTLRAEKDFDWCKGSVPLKFKKGKKLLPKRFKKSSNSVFNIADNLRISHEALPPEPRSIMNIQSYIPKRSLVTELSANMLETIVKVPLLDINGNEVRNPMDNKVLYKKQKLKDVINKPTAYIQAIYSHLKVENKKLKTKTIGLNKDNVSLSNKNNVLLKLLPAVLNDKTIDAKSLTDIINNKEWDKLPLTDDEKKVLKL